MKRNIKKNKQIYNQHKKDRDIRFKVFILTRVVQL